VLTIVADLTWKKLKTTCKLQCAISSWDLSERSHFSRKIVTAVRHETLVAQNN
jgi:hypothetical protein